MADFQFDFRVAEVSLLTLFHLMSGCAAKPQLWAAAGRAHVQCKLPAVPTTNVHDADAFVMQRNKPSMPMPVVFFTSPAPSKHSAHITRHSGQQSAPAPMDCEPITYHLRGKTRAIAAVSDPSSSSVNSQFLAGTCSVRAGNEVLSN